MNTILKLLEDPYTLEEIARNGGANSWYAGFNLHAEDVSSTIDSYLAIREEVKAFELKNKMRVGLIELFLPTEQQTNTMEGLEPEDDEWRFMVIIRSLKFKPMKYTRSINKENCAELDLFLLEDVNDLELDSSSKATTYSYSVGMNFKDSYWSNSPIFITPS